MVSTPSAFLFILIYLHYICVCAQLHLILCGSTDCLTLCGSPVHDVFQARMLEWGAISYPRGSSQPRDQTCVFYVSPALAGVFFTTSTTWEDSPGKKLLKVYRAQAILKFPLCCIFYSVLLRDWKEALAFPAEDGCLHVTGLERESEAPGRHCSSWAEASWVLTSHCMGNEGRGWSLSGPILPIMTPSPGKCASDWAFSQLLVRYHT